MEFVGLRPKMYSFVLLKDAWNKGEIVEKHRAKGIQAAASKSFRHHHYVEQLHRPHENYTTTRRIGSKLHQLYTWEEQKRALCAFDDKRFLLEDGVHSLAFGHHRITGQVRNEYAAEDDRNPVIDAMEAKMDGISHEDREAYEELLSGLDPDALTGPVDVAKLETNADDEPPQGLAPTKKRKAEERNSPQA